MCSERRPYVPVLKFDSRKALRTLRDTGSATAFPHQPNQPYLLSIFRVKEP
jgi:hypothetical protein